MKMIDGYTPIRINRNNLFNDTYNVFMNTPPQELKKRLGIIYEGEIGIDAGGLLRDFFYQISKEFGNPDYSLFKYTNENSYELEINPDSGLNDFNHLYYFKFIGRMIGLAIFHKQYFSVYFNILLCKKILNKKLEFSDLKYIDSQMFENLNNLKNNDGAENLSLTFAMDIENSFGEHKTIELKPNGENIDVNDSNKNEYIELVAKHKLNNTNEQIDYLKQGFYEIIPYNINSLLDEVDLRFLISGISKIDVNDWEKNTNYEGYTKNDITIINFWKCVKKFNNENLTKLLLFVTGNSQVPVTGFKDLLGSGGRIQKFTIKKVEMITENDLPKSHTCFNRIDLPPYTSYTLMKQKLLRAFYEVNGFLIA
ncbi:HECT-domain-containing protein [Anaeromyces robustus]|uniref:HECT-type E3 ubiquitin transferase n=1 Tax=Anaeromyces robustus TaxID=1754192 RepID=A0A1Y1XE56_9FUNG|nr:HECT-domain-containing protein [Anaeromyces robustus]|eukprot:ORX83736.1 HECT-domain-containing protein [Anaeromyces robustus]